MRPPPGTLLPLDLLDTFAAWARKHGYVSETPRGPAEMLRLRSAIGGEPMPFLRSAVWPEHLTTSDKGARLVRDFLRERRARG